MLTRSAPLSSIDIVNLPSGDLSQYVSEYLGCEKLSTGSTDVYFEKKIIVKEEIAANLKLRLTELIKFEDAKRVIFGIFTNGIQHDEVCRIFREVTTELFKKSTNIKSGRILCVEINGSGKGCGIVAADDKIRTWKDA